MMSESESFREEEQAKAAAAAAAAAAEKAKEGVGGAAEMGMISKEDENNTQGISGPPRSLPATVSEEDVDDVDGCLEVDTKMKTNGYTEDGVGGNDEQQNGKEDDGDGGVEDVLEREGSSEITIEEETDGNTLEPPPPPPPSSPTLSPVLPPPDLVQATTTLPDSPGKEPHPENSALSPSSAALESIPTGEPLISSSVRTISHTKLRSYEANRREAYGTKLSSSSLYWRSFRWLINGALEETRRAELLIKSSWKADVNYGVHMKCIFDNMIDSNDGSAIVDEKRRKKLLKQRGLEEGGGGDAGGSMAGTGDVQHHHHHSGVKKGFKLHDKASIADYSAAVGERRGSMLKSLEESYLTISDRFREYTDVMEKEIVPEFTSLREQLEEEVVVMEALGDAILKELQGAEKNVSDAWEAYYEGAVKSLAGGDATDVLRARRQGASDSSKTNTDIVAFENCHDVWIDEMKYRMSVAYLSACWEKASSELSRLFTTMKETECSRRFRLRELLISCIQRKERLFVSLPSVLSPVLKDLVNRPMDAQSIEDDVQTSIRVRAQSIQREEMADKKRSTPGSGLTGVNIHDGQFELSSPLLSDLLCRARVVEKKSSGMIASWKTTLAIVTGDSFLHLFEIPNSLKVQSGSAPEVAFHALVPPVEIPTEDSVKVGGKHYISAKQRHDANKDCNGGVDDASINGDYAVKAWSTHLTPTASIVLPNSIISFTDKVGNSAFEITETYFTHGASKVFGKTTTRRFYLRTLTREEAVDWISVLKAPK